MLLLGLLKYKIFFREQPSFFNFIRSKEKQSSLVKAQLVLMCFPLLPMLLENLKGFYSEAETSINIQHYMVSLPSPPSSPFMCTGDCGFSYRLKCMHVS